MKDILARWEQCSKIPDPTSDNCSFCGCRFVTGDVSLMFGEIDNLAAKRHYGCANCSTAALERNVVPSATMVYVQNEHRGLDFDALPSKVQDHFAEALTIVDRIHRGVEDWVAANRSLVAEG